VIGQNKQMGQKGLRLLALFIFGIAFGLVEAAVVVYLRQDLRLSPMPTGQAASVWINVGVIAFLRPGSKLLGSGFQTIEMIREASTIIMLVAVAGLAGRNRPERGIALLTVFAIWDLSYYFWLRWLIGWPKSLMDLDIFFLIPIPWVGPVVTPIVIDVGLITGGIWYFVGMTKLIIKRWEYQI
jgi:hypothetical protein